MLIAKMRPKTHRDPLFAIVISVIVASVLSVYPLSLRPRDGVHYLC